MHWFGSVLSGHEDRAHPSTFTAIGAHTPLRPAHLLAQPFEAAACPRPEVLEVVVDLGAAWSVEEAEGRLLGVSTLGASLEAPTSSRLEEATQASSPVHVHNASRAAEGVVDLVVEDLHR